MPMTAAPTHYKTSLDYMAEGYWQDFLARQPIAGGIAYEAALYACQLDASLVSLQRVDTLLSRIRRDIIRADDLDESAVLADAYYRNLLIFLAFYAGRVLAEQGQRVVHWYDASDLREYASHLTIRPDDFYQRMAATYHQSSDKNAALFFALEPIGMRLFGHIDRPFVAVEGGQVPSSLYQAVKNRLQSLDPTVDSHKSASMAENKKPLSAIKAQDIKNSSININNVNGKVIGKTEAKAEPLIKKESIADIAKTEANKDNLSHQPNNSDAINVKKTTVTPEVFTKLLSELATIEVAQSAGQTEYHRAIKVLDQFERHIARQNKPRTEVVFSQTHDDARQKALRLLEQSATAGNTAAMLRLAMYELLGETDKKVSNKETSNDAGVVLIKQAADADDNRAQRLLSRLYYQGAYVPQDMTQGRYWLEQAAKNGHPDAATVVSEWQRAEALITTKKQEQHSIKRYQVLIGAIAFAAILLFIFV